MVEYKFSIATNEYLPLRDVVFNTLRDAILSGKLAPGERLMENHLAEKLGVSRTPIREALRMLEIENLVELVPRKGAQVLDMSEKDIRDVLEVRGVLEALGVRLACQKMSSEQMQELELCQRDFIQAYEENDYEKTAVCDEKFHNTIFQATGNEKLIQIVNNLRIQLYRYRVAYIKVPGLKDITIDQHNEILRCIEARQAEEGARLALDHVEHQTKVILDSIKNDDHK